MKNAHSSGGPGRKRMSSEIVCAISLTWRSKNRIAVELHNFEIFSEKVNYFNAVSGGFPSIETTTNTAFLRKLSENEILNSGVGNMM
jgi:hypothetical protein